MNVELRPSNLHRRAVCPGSGVLEGPAPEEDEGGEYAERGTKLHAAMAECLEFFRGMREPTSKDQVVAGQMLLGETLERLRADLGSDWGAFEWTWDAAVKLIQRIPESARILVEEEFDLSEVHPGMTTGTADLVAYQPFGSGIVVDWKFGHKPVTTAGANLQLATYALALQRRYFLREVTVVIVQPAMGLVDPALLGEAELARAHERIKQICSAAVQPWAPLVPTDNGCRYCRAIKTCPAVLEMVSLAEAHDFTDFPEELGGVSCGLTLPVAEVVASWAGAIKKRAMQLLLAGVRVPGYRLKTGRKTREWSDAATPAALAEALDLPQADLGKLVEPAELKSPAQVEKVVGKSKRVREALAPFITSRDGNPVIDKEE